MIERIKRKVSRTNKIDIRPPCYRTTANQPATANGVEHEFDTKCLVWLVPLSMNTESFMISCTAFAIARGVQNAERRNVLMRNNLEIARAGQNWKPMHSARVVVRFAVVQDAIS